VGSGLLQSMMILIEKAEVGAAACEADA
jgi:hypothetical protein